MKHPVDSPRLRIAEYLKVAEAPAGLAPADACYYVARASSRLRTLASRPGLYSAHAQRLREWAKDARRLSEQLKRHPPTKG